jgi:multiple sugar transport system permease protein
VTSGEHGAAAPRLARGREARSWPRLPRGARRRQLTRLLYAVPSFGFLALFFAYPLYLMVRMALHEVSIGTVNAPDNDWVGLANFADLFADSAFRSAVPRTLVFVVATVALQLAGGLLLALLFNARLRGVSIGRFFVFFIWLLPPVVTGAIWKTLLDGSEDGVFNHLLLSLGLVDEPIVFLVESNVALGAIVVVNAWAGIPFACIVLMAALQNLPQDVFEAARVDGASAFRRFRSLTVPLLAPTLWILGVLLVIYAFKTFDFIYVLTNGGPGTSTATIPFLAYVTSFAEYDFGHGAAIAVLTVVASILLSSPYVLRATREQVGH